MARFVHGRSPSDAARAFTLIELLVVIGIIAVIAGLLLPALAAARHAGKAIRCASNMRQIGVAFHLYANESRQVLPFANYSLRGLSDPPGTPASYCVTWDDLLNAHLGGSFTGDELASAVPPREVPVLLCPSDEMVNDANPPRIRRSYSMNRVPYPIGGSPPGDGTDFLGVAGVREFYGTITALPHRLSLRTTEVRRAAETFLAVEFPVSGNELGGVGGAVLDGPWFYANIAIADVRLTNHRGRWNYLYVDGHVEALEPLATLGTGTLQHPRGPWTRMVGD